MTLNTKNEDSETYYQKVFWFESEMSCLAFWLVMLFRETSGLECLAEVIY